MTFHFFSKKKVSKDIPIFRRRRSSGFALMVALGLMSFVLLIILGLSTLVQVNSNITSAEKDLATAKQNALFALNLAIGDLQNEMGPDQRISATASILDEFPETEAIEGVNNPYWTGSWNSNDPLDGIKVNQVVSKHRTASDGKPTHFRKWLVSTQINSDSISDEDRIEFAKNFGKNSNNAVLLVGSGTVGEEATEQSNVYAPRQIIYKEFENENGYAYWVGDEGVKARVAGTKAKEIDNDLDKIIDANNSINPRLNAIEGFIGLGDISDQMDKILTLGTAQFAFNEALSGNIDAFKSKFHSLSAFSRGLMIDVKKGGVRKDLSLLFASESLPPEYDEEPMFIYDSSLGPTWNYALRYHNMYKRIRNDSGRNYINTSDFWKDAKTWISRTDTKYADIPVPVLARMQLIFSLHAQRNTYNGKENDKLPIEDPNKDIVVGKNQEDIYLENLDDWDTSGGADVEQGYKDLNPFVTIPFGTAFTVEDTNEGTYFTTSDDWKEAFPLEFIQNEGEVVITREDDLGDPTISGYVEFIGNDSSTEGGQEVRITEDFSLEPDGLNAKAFLTIPIYPNAEFNEFRLHFNADAIGTDVKLLSLLIKSDAPPPLPKPQTNYEKILHLMMTPIFYLWNPYNVEIVMDKANKNKGAYEYFYTPPEIEFTLDGTNWASLQEFGTFQFGEGGELFNMWSSNNENNYLTNGDSFNIPAGEFRYNITIPPPTDSDYDDDWGEFTDPYLRMQFFNVKSTTKYYNLFSSDSFQEDYTTFQPEPGVDYRMYEPDVANWVESTNDWETHTHMGVFSPVLNYINVSGEGTSYKKIVRPEDVIKFGIRLKNQAFTSKLSLGAGWSNPQPNSYSTSNVSIYPSRFIGALNLDTHNIKADPFNPSDYHKSESKILTVSGRNLWDNCQIRLDQNENFEFVGMKNAPKIGINIDIRGFSEATTPGKNAFFIDPANNYYYDIDETDTTLALAPFRIYVDDSINDSSEIIQKNENSSDSASIVFETMANDKISKCVAKELPLIPLLSLAQLDHAPLGRDYDHFAYFHGRELQGNTKVADENNKQSYSLLGRSRISKPAMFRGKKVRKMAPSFNMAVGNSWAHPTIPLSDIIETEGLYDGYATDRSYLLNETLFDSYFFTGLAFPSGPFKDDMKEMNEQLSMWISREGSLLNANYNFKMPNTMTQKEVLNTISSSNVDTLNLFDKIANFIEIKGAFNINSTSVDSWVSQLTSLRGKSVLYDDSGTGPYSIDDTNTENTPVLSQTIPAEKSLENSGGTIESIKQNSWSHYRSLEDEQLYKLAEEIVKQIKARGPFLSLSQFFNREISEREQFNIKGAVQTAIDESLLNIESTNENVTLALKERFEKNEGNKNWIANSEFTSPEIFEGGNNEGLPGYITQASILRPLCPILTARSDTFIIRAYGDFKKNGEIKSKAWCEAIVQRRIDLIDEVDLLNLTRSRSDTDSFNRKFEIVSFRWLNSDEI
jgi:hypothetical protein